ncbi:alpha/beta fold hydrolase, partial [Brevibacterium sp. HMSC07C04]|uniref:alpha/beta fold hydrolase n=2 Tax=unclassified Brevibacterium TaxID=2614124 RepID=UPI0008A42DA2
MFAAVAVTSLAVGVGVPVGASPVGDAPAEPAPESPSAGPSHEPTDEAGESASDQPSGQPKEDASEAESQKGKSSEKSGQKDAAKAAKPDEHYPELAKKLFKKGEGRYEIPAPKPGGKSAGKVPAGLEAYYSQKIDWSAKNCEALDFDDSADMVDMLGRAPECGYMIAPIDAKNPAKGNIAIAVKRVKAGKLEQLKDSVKFTPNKKPQGSILFNAGRPGQPGLSHADGQAYTNFEIAENFDMVGFDPRGVGDSMPFSECESDKERDASRALNPLKDGRDKAEEVYNAEIKKTAQACFDNTGKLFGLDAEGRKDLIKHLGTWDAVGDMDMLRSVVGDKKLNYVGQSYGTSLGYRYAQKFGDNVGKLVFDGVVDPGDAEDAKALKEVNERSDSFADLEDPEEAPAGPDKASKGKDETSVSGGGKASGKPDLDGLNANQKKAVEQGAGFQNAFEEFAKNCVAVGREGKTYGELWPHDFQFTPVENKTFRCALGDTNDVKVLTENNTKLLQKLETADGGKGLPTGRKNDKRRVTFMDGRTGMLQGLESTDYWGNLNLALNELKEGKSAPMLLQLADWDNSRYDGHYDPMRAAGINIRCTDSNRADEPVDKAKLARARKFVEAYDAVAPFQRASVSPGRYDVCDFWKFKGTLPKPQKLSKVPNILVISTTHDPATPYANGVKMAEMIDGSLLSVSGTSHGAFGGLTSTAPGPECVDTTVHAF